MKCYKFNKLEHIAGRCKSEELCADCGANKHDSNIQCRKSGINCRTMFPNQQEQSAKNNYCPWFIRGKEILATMAIENVDKRAVAKKYNETHRASLNTRVQHLMSSDRTTDSLRSIRSEKEKVEEVRPKKKLNGGYKCSK